MSCAPADNSDVTPQSHAAVHCLGLAPGGQRLIVQLARPSAQIARVGPERFEHGAVDLPHISWVPRGGRG